MSTAARHPGAVLIACAVAGLVLYATATAAAEMRGFRAIRSAPETPGDATPVTEIVAVPRAVIERGVRELLAAWNTPALEDKLAEGFYDRRRLLDAVESFAPRDATLRLLAIEGAQTVQQFVRDSGDGSGKERLSRVSVRVRLQIEFTDPARGFQVRPGRMELILQVVEPLG